MSNNTTSERTSPGINDLHRVYITFRDFRYLVVTADKRSFDYMFGEGDPWAYWPGRLISTLKVLRRTVQAYQRAEPSADLPLLVSEAGRLIVRLNAFQATTAPTHLSNTITEPLHV